MPCSCPPAGPREPPSPADPLVDAGYASRIADAYEIDDGLAFAQAPGHVTELRRRVADDDGAGMRQDLIDARHHQPGDMRDVIEDVVPVGPVDARGAHVLVVYPQPESLSDQALHHLAHRACPQVIGSRLEAEAKDADLLVALRHDRAHAALADR